VGAIVGVEVFLFVRYLEFGALFHFFVHSFAGAGLAIATVVGYRVCRPGATPPPASQPALQPALQPGLQFWAVALVGHLAAGLPDVLFLLLDLPHRSWMDAFVAHVAIHFVPAPLLTTAVVFVAGLAALVAQSYGRRRLAGACVLATLAVMSVALVARGPLPGTLEEVRATPGVALWCPLTTADSAGAPTS
jgi:hypothetical protein